jgi:hypothetical protein
MQVAFDKATLGGLLAHASSAARLVGHIDDGTDGTSSVGQLSDHIDAIVHVLSELLGHPHLKATELATQSLIAPLVLDTRGGAR